MAFRLSVVLQIWSLASMSPGVLMGENKGEDKEL
jgi:hypothetical protein